MLVRTDHYPWMRPVINDWIAKRNGGRAFPESYEALGWMVEGQLTGGIAFHTCNGVNCFANIALDGGKANPGGLIKAGLTYAFSSDQLALRRLTFPVSSSNLKSQSLVEGLGSTLEATLREAEPEGDLLIYALFSESCPIWRRIHERRQRPILP